MSLKIQICILVLIAVIIPSLTRFLLPSVPALGRLDSVYTAGSAFPPSPIKFERTTVGETPVGLPLITNVQVVDLNGDGQPEILGCDVGRTVVSAFHRQSDGSWKEEVLLHDISAAAHVTVVDIDGDGDADLVVSILGDILPNDEMIGRVELYVKQADRYQRHVILTDVRRVADVQPADFDQDGDLDLAVAVFGYNRGQILWLENRGDYRFRDHVLLNAPGTIHVPVSDYDGDGDWDIAAIVTQDEEELWAFENLGNGQFKKRKLWSTFNYDLGGAGLVKADLDQDGDDDLIFPAGDNLEDYDAFPQPYHGCFWFENEGDWKFTRRRIATYGGTYAAAVADFDGDGDQDVVLVSMTNEWTDPDHASVVWLENDGWQQFQSWQIDSQPIHLVTVAVGDLDQDGKSDVVAGALNLRKPFIRVGGISAWLNQGAAE